MSWSPEEVARIERVEDSLTSMAKSITRIESALVGYEGNGGILQDMTSVKARVAALETHHITRDAIEKSRAAKWGIIGGIGGSVAAGVVLILFERFTGG